MQVCVVGTAEGAHSLPHASTETEVIVDCDGVVDVAKDDERLSDDVDVGSLLGLVQDSISLSTASCGDTEGLGPAADMQVLGIYKRGKVPRESELPEDYVLKDCAADQIMVRERLHTRPFPDDGVEEEAPPEADHPDASSDGSEGGQVDDEHGPTTVSPKKKKSGKEARRGRTKRAMRRRLKTRMTNGQEYDVAAFEPEGGLVTKKSDWPFFHADLSEHSDSSGDERVYEERAILWQSTDNYETLMSNPTTSKYFLPPPSVEEDAKGDEAGGDTAEGDAAEGDAAEGNAAEGDAAEGDAAEVDAGDEPANATTETINYILDDPCFGEQILVKGMTPDDIAIGDVFEVEAGLSPLKVEVSSPRLPCSWLDKRVGAPFGTKGIRRHTMTHGLAGWFTRVLVPGELRDGMRLVRTAHPNPKWTLAEVSMALYGEGPPRRQMLGYPYWSRSREELEELCSLRALGRVDWKDEATWILNGKDKEYEEDQRKKKEESEALARGEAEVQDSRCQGAWWQVGERWPRRLLYVGGVALATAYCSPIFSRA